MADVKAEIEAQMKKMEEAFYAKDEEKVLSFYVDDCRVLPAGAPMVVGKEALKKFFDIMKPLMEKIGKMENNLVDVTSTGDMAVTVYTGIAYDKEGNVLDNRKSMTVFKKVNGNWLIQWTAWSSDKPTPYPAQ